MVAVKHLQRARDLKIRNVEAVQFRFWHDQVTEQGVGLKQEHRLADAPSQRCPYFVNPLTAMTWHRRHQ